MAVQFFVDRSSQAYLKYEELRRRGDAAADLIQEIATQPQGVWLIDDGAASQVADVIARARVEGGVPIFVVYGHRVRSGAAYRTWLDRVAAAMATAQSIAIIEPDAWDEARYIPAVAYAVEQIKRVAGKNVYKYIDAGHPGWMADSTKLRSLRIDDAEGFSLNVSNFVRTRECIAAGRSLANQVNKGFIIDTSRNGRGTAGGHWCNPTHQALGEDPRWVGDSYLHAALWVKRPGESDGDPSTDRICGDHPPPGEWDQEYAEGLVLARRQDSGPGVRWSFNADVFGAETSLTYGAPPEQKTPAGTG